MKENLLNFKYRLSNALRFVVILMITAISLTGCKTSPLVTDYSINPVLSMSKPEGSSKTIYPNSKIPLKLEVKTAIEGVIKVEYLPNDSDGILYKDDEEIYASVIFEHDFTNALLLSFMPRSTGPCILSFRLSNEHDAQTVTLSFNVDEAAFHLSMISDTLVTVGVKDDLVFAIRELQSKTKADSKVSSNKFRIKASIRKGRGILQVKDKILDDNSSTEPSSKTDNSTESEVEVKIDEETPMYYTSMLTGENTIDFDISDEHGNIVTTTINLGANSSLAEIKYSVNQDSSYKAAVMHNFFIYPDTKGNENELTLSWVIDKKSTIQNISVLSKTEPFLSGDKVILSNNSANNFSVLTNSIGSLGMTFEIRDEFGSKYDSTVVLKIISPSVDFEFPDVATELSKYKPYEWIGNLLAEVGTNSYNISYTNAATNKDIGVLTINGQDPINGENIILKNGGNIFNYTPTKIGTPKLELKVSDKFGNEQVLNLNFIVNENTLGITIGEFSPVQFGESVNITVNIPTQEHIESFSGVISDQNGVEGTIEVNGRKVNENSPFDLKTGTNMFRVTPTTLGDEYKWTLLTTANIGQEESHEISVPIISPTLNVTTTANGATIKYKTATRFTITIGEAEHTEPFSLTPSFVNGSGTLTMEEDPVTMDVITQIDGGTYNFVFTPDDCGEADIKFLVRDKRDKEAFTNARFTVEPYPLSFIMGNQSAASINMGMPVTYTLAVDETEAPNSPYTLTYSIGSGAGTVKMGAGVFNAGTSKTLTKGTHNFSYTPSAVGSNRITFKLVDMFGQEKTQTLNIDAKNAVLNANASSSSLSTAIKKAASFTIAASEKDYTGKFKLSHTKTGGDGSLTVAGTTVNTGTPVNINSGNTSIGYTPTTLGTHTLNFTVEDDFGQEKEFSVTVTATHASMTASVTGGGNVYINRAKAITLNVNEDNYEGNFTVSVSGGTGTLKNGGTTWNRGSNYTIGRGATNLTYTPTTTGSHVLTFTLTDSYGQVKSTNVTINSTHAGINISATPSTASVYVGATATATLAVNESDHSGQFTVRPSFSGGSLTINGTAVGNGGSIRVNPGNSSIGFIPSSVGTHTITLNADDAHGQTKSTTFKVTGSHPEISASVNSPSIYVNNTGEIVLSISKDNYGGGMYTVYVAKSGGSGSLTLNGGSVGGSFVVGSGTTRLKYAPTSEGRHNFTFTIVASDGKRKVVSSTVSVPTEYPEIRISKYPDNMNVTNGTASTTFSVSAYKAGYGEVSVSTRCDGSQASGGQFDVWLSGNTINASVNRPPDSGSASQTFTLTFTATDNVGRKTIETTTFYVEYYNGN